VAIEDHYGLLLGINSPWDICSAALDLSVQKVDMVIEHTDDTGACPECGVTSPKHDDRKEEAIPYIGIDEKQFRSGHRYIRSLVDLKGSRVLAVVEERTDTACQSLMEQGVIEFQQKQVTAVALDMWKAHANAVADKLPQADSVHNHFHISQHLNEAVVQVRRKENKALFMEVDSLLVGSKFLWLTNEANLKEKHVDRFEKRNKSDLKVARALAIKELFRGFWDDSDAGLAEQHFNGWYSWAIRSRLEPINAKARMIKTHVDNILTYFTHGISHAAAEGLHSKIQTVKSNARGYRSFSGCRNSILFYCGGLEMAP
jgi:transposase